MMSCLLNTCDTVWLEPFMHDRSIIALHIRTLLRLARFDFLDWAVVFFRPLQKLALI